MRFEGTSAYVADKDLMVAVNASIAACEAKFSQSVRRPTTPQPRLS